MISPLSNIFRLFSFLALVSVFIIPPFHCRAESMLFGTVVSVMDGDTLGVRTSKRAFVKVRLYGIDAPEHGQAYGKKAKRALSDLVFKKKVSVLIKDRDQYGRIVGIVISDGENINERMVRAGYAWVYKWFCKEPEKSRWLKLEKEAKAGRKGLWAGKKPMPPWKWRRARR